MPATYAIAEALNAIITTLDPVQRWQSARQFDGSWITQKWFILISLFTLLILISIALIISFKKNSRKNKAENLTFANVARNKGLSPHEIKILKDIANGSKLKNKIEVSTTKKVFDDSVKKIIDEQKRQKNPEQIEKLKTELNLLRVKLGFHENEHPTTEVAVTKQLSTRQIPLDKTLHIIAIKSKTDEIESTVIENTETGLIVKLTAHPRINFNEQWKGRYSLEDNVCEFDTSVISYDGTCLVLAHSENVHCFNRRRFLREPVEHRALVALFPRNKTTEDKNFDNKTDTNATESSQQNDSSAFCPPEFINAIVTEIGGTSLKIKTDLEAREGDRILIILNLSEPKQRIVQDIALVKRIVQNQDGNFLAAVMFGLSDEHIEELVHATNTAPTDANIAPTDADKAPTDENTAPTDANTTPTDANTVPTDANIAPIDENTAPIDENIAPIDENTAPIDENTATTDANATPTDEPQEKNDNANNTNTNEENQQSNITQEA